MFINFEEGFEVYEGFALNQKKACQIAVAESSKLASLSHIMDPTYELPCYLIKPIQRICKYPLLLRELVKYTPEDWPNYKNQVEALESIKRVTLNVNETQRRVENISVVKQLSERLMDWKGHNLNDFGALLHDGVFPIIKTGTEREYHMYLFENIILCCKEAAPPKKGMTLSSKKQKPKRASLMLKGRIYMAFITHISSDTKNGYILHIAWGKDASDSGFFDVRFRNDEQLEQWEMTINQMMARYNDPNAEPIDSPHSLTDATLVNGTSYDDEPSDDEVYDLPNQPSAANTSHEAYDDDPTSTSISQDLVNSSYPINNGEINSHPYAYQQQIPAMPESMSSQMNVSHSGSSSSNTSINNTLTNLNALTRQEPSKSTSSLSVGSTTSSAVKTRSASVPINGAHSDVPPIPMPSLHATSQSDTSAEPSVKNSNLTEIPPPSIVPTDAVPTHAAKKPANMKVKLHYLDDAFLLIMPSTVTYSVLLERVERKIRLCGKQTPSPLRIKYKDEDDDFVTMHGDEDIQMALENGGAGSAGVEDLTVWAA